MGNCKGKLSKESKNQMRGEAYRPSKPDTQGKETIHVEGKPVIKNDNGEDAVVINAKIPFVNPETPTKSESVMQGPNTSVSDTNGLKESESTGKQDQKLHESDAFPEKPNEKQNKNVLSSANIENNSGEETNLKEAPPTGITLNKVPDYKSDDAEIEKPGYLFSQGCKGEEAQTEDSGFTDKITGLKVPLPTDQSSSSHDTVPTEKAKDEDKNLTKVDDNVPTKKASGNVSEPTVENKSNQSNEHKDDSTEKTSDKLQPGSTPSDKLQSGNTPSDKLQLGNTSDNQQNKNDSTGYNHSKFSNPCDEQDKKMSKEMKEIDGKKKKKKKKKPDKYDPLPNAVIQNYYGYVDTVIFGNDIVNNIVEKVPIVETFQPSSTISQHEMKVLLKVSESVGMFHGPWGTGTCWRVGKDKVLTAAHVVRNNIWSSVNKFLNEENYKQCYVDFNYNGQTKKDTNSKYVFDIEMTPYMDETLDVAVVKLKRDIHKEFPPPLEYFEVLDPEKNDDEHIYLIGHDKGNKLHINYGIGLWNPTEKRLTDLVKFCQEYGKENGYKELDRKDRLVIQCKFVTGASGCPGVIIHGDKASVVLIYTRGYPDFYFSKNFPQKDKQAFPDEKLLQQGVNIGPVFESMTKNKTYLNLRNEIFPHQASEEQQQLNGQHQYAIDGAKKTNPESTFENVKDLDNHTTVRQETGNTTGNLTTCTDEGAKTAIPESVKCIRQVSYVLATGGKENLSLAYQQFENQGVQNITVNKSGLNINPDTNLDVNGDSTLRMPANPGKTRPMEHISIEEWIGNDMQAYKEKQLKEFELSLLSKAINVSKANSVALQLGLTQSDFEQFRHQGQTDLCYLILYKWRNKNGNGATLERLIGILFCAWESNNESVFTEDLKSAILRVMK